MQPERIQIAIRDYRKYVLNEAQASAYIHPMTLAPVNVRGFKTKTLATPDRRVPIQKMSPGKKPKAQAEQYLLSGSLIWLLLLHPALGPRNKKGDAELI